MDDDVRGRRPRDRARDHLVAGSDAEGEQREVERRGARRDGEDVPCAEILAEALLELGGAGAGREPARAERLGDGRDLLVADRRRLEREEGRPRRPLRDRLHAAEAYSVPPRYLLATRASSPGATSGV